MKLKNLLITAMFIALGVILPVLLHLVFPQAVSRALLPMHIPVLICGLCLGPVYGLACGAITPVLSALITSMPPMAMVPPMLCELAIYGLAAGLLIKIIRTKSTYVNILLSLLGAMLAGRVVYGILSALIFQAGEYSFGIWISSLFATALPGIVLQILLVPIIVLALRNTKLIKI